MLRQALFTPRLLRWPPQCGCASRSANRTPRGQQIWKLMRERRSFHPEVQCSPPPYSTQRMSEKLPQRWGFSTLPVLKVPARAAGRNCALPLHGLHLIQTSFRRGFAREGDDQQADGECDRGRRILGGSRTRRPCSDRRRPRSDHLCIEWKRLIVLL
jgi:hypothetical protein